MKRSVKLVPAILTLILALSLAVSALADPIRVAVVQPLTHTSLNQIRDTIVSELKNSGIEFEIVTRNAEGDSSAKRRCVHCRTRTAAPAASGVAMLVPPLNM